MAYGTLKCDNITFDSGGSDQNVTVSGLYRATTSGVTVSGTIAATTVSGVTVIGSTTVSGATVTGTTANFTSGNFSNIISSAATMSGALIMANQQQVRFREAVGNGVNHIALQAPASVVSDQTITLPEQTGTLITTGDNGSVSSTMLATNLTISAAAGSAAAPSIAFTGDTNTGIYSPGADQLAVVTNGIGRLFVNASGLVCVGNNGSPACLLDVTSYAANSLAARFGNVAGRGLEISTFIVSGTNDAGTVLNAKGSGNGTFVVQTESTERLRIDSSGRVGIGTTSPLTKLEVRSGVITAGSVSAVNGAEILRGYYGSTGALTVIGSEYSSGGPVIGYAVKPSTSVDSAFLSSTSEAVPRGAYTIAGNIHKWYIGASQTVAENSSVSMSEAVRIDSSGRLLVGTSTAPTTVNSVKQFCVETSGSYTTAVLVTNQNNANSAYLALQKSRGSTAGSMTVVQSNDELGGIQFIGADGTTPHPGAQITAYVDGTPGANDMPGRLVFSTTADGASTTTERMRIASNGLFTMGGLYVFTTAGAANVNVDSSGVVQRSTSSIKYKTDIETLENSYSEALLECRPVWYRSTCKLDNPDWGWWGFIAEEVAQIDPRLVHWKTTEFSQDDQGATVSVPCDPEPEGVAYDRFVPHLLNLIKQQKEQAAAMQARIETLEAAVAALQGA